jgi:3-deoxy-manno-octulosonate cytidylyltransferase (CMP-KDO synthetase)
MLEAITTASPSVAVVNAYATLTSEADFRSTTVPKVVVDLNGRLLYISRASIPTTKTLDYLAAARQIGLYAFRDTALALFSRQKSKTPLEAIEDIEILRFLELGVEVRMIQVPMGGIAIDTPEDLMRAQHFLRR